jgi:integrase
VGIALTDRKLKSLRPAKPGQRYDVMDTVRGFGVRVTDKGQRTFILIARYPGSTNPTRRALGEYPTLTLEKAREKARAWHKLLAEGVDPRVEELRVKEDGKRKAQEAVAVVENRFEARAMEYLRRHCKDHRRVKGTARMIDKELMPHWRMRRIDEITSRDIKTLILDIAERSPSVARNTLTVCKSFFGWAQEPMEYITASPAAAISARKLIGEKKPRQRVLTDDEIRKFWVATSQLGYPYQHLYRLIALTGVRLHEASDASWSEFDLDRRLWVVPPERFKSDCHHVVPLSNAVMQLIEEMPRFGEFLFTINGRRPVNGFQLHKQRLDAFMGVTGWVVHDLRRVVRSKLASLKVSDTIAELVIGHGKKGLQRVYDQHSYEAEIREALELWAARLRDIVTPPPENVVRMKKERASR